MQYANPQQQRDTATFGMWVFLATEVLFFGGLFASYAVYRMYYTQAFLEGSRELDPMLGAISAAVLLTSSLTVSLACRGIAEGKQFRTYILLLLTALGGLAFLGIELSEYFTDYHAHKIPGIWFESNKPDALHEEMFFVFYFCMTGLHMIHVSIGVGLAVVMAVRTALGRFNAAYHTAVDIFGLYWQFVDMIWAFLFAVFYVTGIHK
jgi:cytochrome c oxidase subunit 3